MDGVKSKKDFSEPSAGFEVPGVVGVVVVRGSNSESRVVARDLAKEVTGDSGGGGVVEVSAGTTSVTISSVDSFPTDSNKDCRESESTNQSCPRTPGLYF